MNVKSTAQATKTELKKRKYIRLKSICAAKEAIDRVKRQPTEWEKIPAINISGRGLISKIYKKLVQFNGDS